jgi:C4-dicarboxylate-specific signal transduction histidine kinase
MYSVIGYICVIIVTKGAVLKESTESDKQFDNRLIEILERQKQDLVIRVLKKHEEVQAGKVFTNKILASFSELFFLLSEDFSIVQANQEFYQCLGYSEDQCHNLSLSHITDKESYNLIRETLLSGEFHNLETHLRTSSQQEVPVNMKGSTYTTESGRVLHMVTATDRSDFYKMMSRMREAQDQLIHSERLASLGEMAAGIGHELTQPLNATLLFARNCVKALDDPVKNREMLEENLNIIIDRVNKASTIIRSLKSFATKEDDKVLPVDINAILKNLLNLLDSQLTLPGIQLKTYFNENLPRVLGQEVKFEQVFLNLIQNAIQAIEITDSPELVIKTSVENGIDPETLEEKLFVVVSVLDNGEGMPPSLQEKIFDPFFTTREVGTGMGLGLSIVDRIIHGFSGFVKVKSAQGSGSCFSIFLPPYEG